ncbi:hypothetical protein KDAU_12900 [Dictyobacter aurantiacus]|uniref:MalT-like TPR region domain-containing protein n=1 Tax=Dictyobacter aurantiacus TaxID=1936993 RepID=A0A401ZAQ3_9CHLR|nr:hypothetical protein KDAU_12900 [Dictyobacter aurantiacus]
MATYLCFIGEILRHQNDQESALRYMEDAKDLAHNASKAIQRHILQMLAYGRKKRLTMLSQKQQICSHFLVRE